ncbi:MAG: hypothetical protein VX899_08080 [Myxococcota bacterium]|nr:hypothetical protein [Myxococcota bacterium]
MTELADGLEVVLSWEALATRELLDQSAVDLAAVQATSEGIARLEERLRAFGLSVPNATSVQKRPMSRRADSLSDWEAVRARAARELARRGVVGVSLDELLDPDEVRRLEARFYGGYTLKTRMDAYDTAAACLAGLVASLVDWLVVRVPKDMEYLGKPVKGSPLSDWLRNLELPFQERFEKWFKVPYDAVRGVDVKGFFPKSHRLQTFGHDPIVGLVVGVIDILRGGLTAVGRDGKLAVLSGFAEPTWNPFKALVWQIGHLISDGFTSMGLPAPGWSLLQLFQIGRLDENERTLAELARHMYLKGYDSRHFLTMTSSVAAASVVLHGYFWLRRKLDPVYESDAAHESIVGRAAGTSDHPRVLAMSLVANSLGAAANAGRVTIQSGNPLAVNYAQWLAWTRSFYQWTQAKLSSPNDVLLAHGRANRLALYEGWSMLEAEKLPLLSA